MCYFMFYKHKLQKYMVDSGFSSQFKAFFGRKVTETQMSTSSISLNRLGKFSKTNDESH